jgi:hypothetical protein
MVIAKKQLWPVLVSWIKQLRFWLPCAAWECSMDAPHPVERLYFRRTNQDEIVRNAHLSSLTPKNPFSGDHQWQQQQKSIFFQW